MPLLDPVTTATLTIFFLSYFDFFLKLRLGWTTRKECSVFDLLWKCGACTSCLNTYTMHLAYTMTPCICVYYDLFSLHVVQDFLVWRWSCFKTQMKLWTQNSVYSPSHPKISKQEIINVESLKTVAWRCLFLSLVQRNNHQTLSTYCIFVTNTSWTIRPEFTIKIFNAIFKKNYAFLYIIQRSY
jgi:hypothetical protein